jgi:hypothetical protein
VAHVVAGSRSLDLDDICTEIGEQPCAIRSRDDARQIENLDAFEPGDLRVSVSGVGCMITTIDEWMRIYSPAATRN